MPTPDPTDRRRRRRGGRPAGGALLLGLALAAAGCGRPLEAGLPAPEADCRRPAGDAGIRWSRPAADAGVLDLWCSGVGAAVARPLPAGPAAARLDSLAILTWNTHVGGGDLVRLVGDLRAGRLTGGEPVRHFVLLLQEVHRGGEAVPDRAPPGVAPARVEEHPEGGERVDVVEASRALGLSLVYVPSMRNGEAGPAADPEDKGNAILSTLPLHDPRAIELPFEAQRRVAVMARLRGTTEADAPWELLVSSTHLDTRTSGARFLATFGAGRLRQARALAEALPGGVPAVVAGDLNTWSLPSLEGTLPYLRSLFPQTPCPSGEPTFATSWGLRRSLDHLFFRLPAGWEARYDRIDDRYGSDHHPLLAWTRIGRPAGAGGAPRTGCAAEGEAGRPALRAEDDHPDPS